MDLRSSGQVPGPKSLIDSQLPLQLVLSSSRIPFLDLVGCRAQQTLWRDPKKKAPSWPRQYGWPYGTAQLILSIFGTQTLKGGWCPESKSSWPSGPIQYGWNFQAENFQLAQLLPASRPILIAPGAAISMMDFPSWLRICLLMLWWNKILML